MGSIYSGRRVDGQVVKGRIYEDWTVESEGPKYRAYHRTWYCRCSCGTVGLVVGSRLSQGKSTGCHECMMAKFRLRRAARRKNRVGERAGRWTVTGPGSRPGMWAVVCECGQVGEITSRTVRRGKSPGCRDCALVIRLGRRPVSPSLRRPGEDVDRDPSGVYLPTPEEIRAACRQIRETLGHPLVPNLS